MTRRPALLAALAYLLIVGAVTLGPAPWRTRPAVEGYDVLSLSTWLSSGTWSTGRPQEFLANILLFVPLGILLRLAFPRATWAGAVLIGGAISMGIEVLQMWGSRVSDPRDVVANTIGTFVGALIAAAVAGLARVARRGVTRVVGGAAGDRSVSGRSVSRPASRQPVG